MSSSNEPVPMRVAAWADGVCLQFGSAPERDRFLHYSGIHVCQTLMFNPDPSARNGKGTDYDITDGHCTVDKHWRFQLNFRLHLTAVPRFGPTEVEGRFIDERDLQVDLPCLLRMPWPKTYGAIGPDQWKRATIERLMWGIATGVFKTQWDAARYVRETMPEVGQDAIRESWLKIMEGLPLPRGGPVRK